jgi:hypothetical protein
MFRHFKVMTAERTAVVGTDHYNEYGCIWCTTKFLRGVLRELFDGRMQHNPYVTIHVKNSSTNMIYEGLHISSWSTDGDGNEAVGCIMGQSPVTCPINDIVSLDIGY